MIESIAQKRAKRLNNILRFGPIVMLVVLFVVMASISPRLLQRASIMNILKQCAVYGILAIGETYMIMTGGIDLSVSAVCCFNGCFIAYLNVKAGLGAGVSVLIGFAVALLVGFINGILTAVVEIPDFIATLGTQTLLNGLVQLLTGGYSITKIDPSILYLGAKSVTPIKIPCAAIVFFVCFAIGWIIQERTTLGRNFLAYGGNKEATRVSGVNIVRTKIAAAMLSAFFAAVGGLILTGRLNSANPLMGGGYELDAIACVVLGGTSITGGRGKMHGTLVGVLIMAIINTGMDMAGLASYYQDIIQGIIIVLILAEDCTIRKKLSNT